VFGYEGRPSWVMVTLQPPAHDERLFGVQVVKEVRNPSATRSLADGRSEAWGRQLPVDLSMVSEIRFVDSGGATFDAASPWE
jgi:hypothetical protein